MPPFASGTGLSITTRFYVLPLIADGWLSDALQSALVQLTQPGNWYQVGTVTPDQAAQACSVMFDDQFQLPDPTGSIIPYAWDPTGVDNSILVCDGTLYNTVDFPQLFGVIGYTFGGSGSQFAVPNLISKFIVGEGGVLLGHAVNMGSSQGQESFAQTINELAAHTHTDSGHVHGYVPALPNVTTIGPGAPQPTAVPGAASTSVGFAGISTTGTGNPIPTVPPSVGLLYCIITGLPA
jgi:microcystin-dependent protein